MKRGNSAIDNQKHTLQQNTTRGNLKKNQIGSSQNINSVFQSLKNFTNSFFSKESEQEKDEAEAPLTPVLNKIQQRQPSQVPK